MNKAELVSRIAYDTMMTKSDIEICLNSCFSNIKVALRTGERVALNGFGTFSVKKRKARITRSIQDGIPIRIPAKNVAKFNPGKGLKDTI